VRLKPAALLTGRYDWDPDVLPISEFQNRLAAVHRMLAEHGLSALIVHGNSTDYAALAYLTEFVPKLGPAFALFSPDHSVRLLVSGSPAMISAAKRLTWVEDVQPIGDLKTSIVAWLGESNFRSNTTIGLWGLGAITVRPYGAITAAIEPRGEIVGLDAALEPLRLRKSAREQEILRRASAILAEAMRELARAFESGDGMRSTTLAAERAAFRLGAQDARALASARPGGPPALPSAYDDCAVDPLLAYAAVRFAGYWAEGFLTLSRLHNSALMQAQAGLAAIIRRARPGVTFAELTALAEQHVRPYEMHPLTKQSIGNSIGLALEEPHEAVASVLTLRKDGVYALRCGAAGQGSDNAIVSAMVHVQESRVEVFWSALPSAELLTETLP